VAPAKQLPIAAAEEEELPQVNRLHELQAEYDHGGFKYLLQKADLRINCQMCYLPFEARIDKLSFELFLQEALPRELLLLGSSRTAKYYQQYCASKDLPIKVVAADRPFQLPLNAAAKRLLLQPSLYHGLPLQTVMPTGAVPGCASGRDLQWLDRVNAGTSALLESAHGKVYQVARLQARVNRGDYQDELVETD
jgi:hypothetical protein